MKKKPSPEPDTQTSKCGEENPLAELLNKNTRTRDFTPANSAPSTAGLPSIALATIIGINDLGQVLVSLPDLQLESVVALSVCPVAKEQIGMQCAVQFVNGNPNQPLIIGILIAAQQNEPYKIDASKNIITNESLVEITAEDEILLACGESSIRLGADGVIELRGVYISSDAMATQRLRGGSVQVN